MLTFQGIAVGARLVGHPAASHRGHGPLGRPTSTADGGISSDQARRDLCAHPAPTPVPQPTSGPGLPAPFQAVADDVQAIRGLSFEHPVQPEAVSRSEIASKIAASIDASYPADRMHRRTLAWRTIGVVAPDADLGAEVRRYAAGAILGFYDTTNHQLVFAGSANPTPFARVVLAHELTHALDDQHFDLSRLDALDAECADDALLAGVSLAEGSARLLQHIYISRRFTQQDYAEYQQESLGGSAPEGVSPFLAQLLSFPYPYGESFVQTKVNAGGFRALNAAFGPLPASTEQILHPERFPKDAPQNVDVPDLALALGDGWEGLDVYDVGEAWLRLALGLRLSGGSGACPICIRAAAGWDGGEYRAWRNGSHVAVAMETVWDTRGDAVEFAAAMKTWLAHTASGAVTKVSRRGSAVAVLWAPDRGSLDAMAGGL